MKLFLKHNKGYIFIYFLGLVITVMYLNINGFIEFGEVLYIIILNAFILICFLTFKYYENKQLYKLFRDGMKSLNDSLIDLGHSNLGEDVSSILKEQHNFYLTEIQNCNKIHKEHIAFINQWVHQMKTPLSVIELQLKEFEGEEKALEIQEEVSKLDKGLNLALYYARLDSFQKDFLVEQILLKELVINTVNKNKKLFVKNRIIPRVEIDEKIKVYSDAKWLKFILEQLITNGVKYSKDKGKELIISTCKNETEVKLSIVDKGVGIVKRDIKRVFDKFFTGENGRRFGESTGMGLYITKEVCKNLGHEIEIESTINDGTTVTIKFKREI